MGALWKLKTLLKCASAAWYINNSNADLEYYSEHRNDMKPEFAPFIFSNYYRRITYEIKNTDNVLKINLNHKENTVDSFPRMSGGILEDEYVLDNVHFHWTSEHKIYGKSYPLEAHFVHYKASKGSYKAALTSEDEDAVAVVAVLYDIVDNPKQKCLKDSFDYLIDHIKNASFKCSVLVHKRIPLRWMLPSNTSRYYTYVGSLSASLYFNNVIWIVMEKSVKINKDQYRLLKSTCEGNGYDEKPIVTPKELSFVKPIYIVNGFRTVSPLFWEN